jgi:hypothetical protein
VAAIQTLGAGMGVNLSNAQVNPAGASTNVCDRQVVGIHPAVLVVQNTGGSTPTVTITPQISVDNVIWQNCGLVDPATPTTFAATLVVTTTGSIIRLITADLVWRYFRLNYSANTNETVTADIYPV